MSDFTKANEFEKEFDPRLYLETYCHLGSGSQAENYLSFCLGNFHKVFTSSCVKGDTVIDIATAPYIHPLLSACESFKEIIATWYTKRELHELQKWQKNYPEAFDWSSIVKYVCELEGNSGNEKEKEAKLRRKIKQVLHCDVSKTNPLEPVVLPKADCVISSVCLEAACRNHESYGVALKNLANLLKPEGHLILTGDLGVSYYKVGAKRVFSLAVNEKFLVKVLKESGYVVKELITFGKPEDTEAEPSDYEGFYFIHAQKC
ncbi:nicotinamide N-methyltransferase-like [Discoglossus pictus]